MKRCLIALALLATFALAPLSAENSELYPVKVEVLKIFAHADGYKVVYIKGSTESASVYLPISWFVPGGKGELVRGTDPAFPYLVVFYKQGKFDHLRLYAQLSYKDDTWGQLSQEAGKGKFDPSQDVKLEF